MIEDRQRVVRGRTAIESLQVLESCSFTWIFDAATRLFRRVPRDATVSLEVPAAWAPYHRLHVDEARSSFVVVMNAEETRVLRAWLHVEPCPRCQPEYETIARPAGRKPAWAHSGGRSDGQE